MQTDFDLRFLFLLAPTIYVLNISENTEKCLFISRKITSNIPSNYPVSRKTSSEIIQTLLFSRIPCLKLQISNCPVFTLEP